MSILIKGVSLPKDDKVTLLAIFSDGDVKYIDRETFLSFRLPEKAVEITDGSVHKETNDGEH